MLPCPRGRTQGIAENQNVRFSSASASSISQATLGLRPQRHKDISVKFVWLESVITWSRGPMDMATAYGLGVAGSSPAEIMASFLLKAQLRETFLGGERARLILTSPESTNFAEESWLSDQRQRER